MGLSRRDRLGAVLDDNRLVTSAELFIVTILQAFDAQGLPAIFFLFPFGWIPLWQGNHSSYQRTNTDSRNIETPNDATMVAIAANFGIR